jgi:hypothetical protein
VLLAALASAVVLAAGGVTAWKLTSHSGTGTAAAARDAAAPGGAATSAGSGTQSAALPAPADQTASTSPPVVTASPAPTASPVPTTPPAGASPPATSTPAPDPATSSLPSPGDPAGAGDQVAVGIGVTQPQAQSVARFVTKYFSSINHRNYPAFRRLYEPVAVPITSEQAFLDDYRTTTDFGGVLVGLSRTAAGGWAATVTFRSHQKPGDSTYGTGCTDWKVMFFLPRPDRPYLFGPRLSGYPLNGGHACH